MEIMIVVVIIGLLMALAIPSFNKIRQEARITTFFNNLRSFRYGIETFSLETGDWPAAGGVSGDLGLYIKAADFAEATPIGGSWNILRNSGGVISAVGVTGAAFPELFPIIDARFDDGNAGSGNLRQISGGFYWVSAE